MKKFNLKKNISIAFTSCLLLMGTTGCNNFLELESLEKVGIDQLLENEGGIKTLLAGIYSTIPMEDFTYRPNAIDEVESGAYKGKFVGAYNRHGWAGVDYMIATSFYTDESSRSDGAQGIGPIQNSERHWTYEWVRDINFFFENILKAKTNGVISEDEYNRLKSEAHFIRAYTYFGLVKRFGGVPLIDRVLDNEFVQGEENASLYIPRSTEKDTWEFVLKECDLAIEYLPATVLDSEGKYRATKWAAYGLKSRAALHAASIAKYWDRAPLSGDAVTQKLVGGMTAADVDYFYEECIKASKEIIDHSGRSLFMPNPADPAEAVKNYQNLFLVENNEVIFSKAYLDGTTLEDQGHSFDIWFSPSQANPGYHKFGRYNPTLDMIDMYEDYTDDGTGQSVKIVTRTDGNENTTIANPKTLDINIPFRKYDNLYEPFKNKDARLLGSVIVPGATFKNTAITIQGGMIKKDGTVVAYADGNDVGHDGNLYYAFGGESTGSFSGFYGMGRSDDANFTSTGFTIRKYLQEFKTVLGTEKSSTTNWIDMRLAEIYLNYAEAVMESGKGDAALAGSYINALRKRAGHTDNIPFTLENVLKERRVELAFEGFRYWDLIRRREYHTTFNSSRRQALVPMIDLREQTPKYIFVRANFYYDEYAGGRTFQTYRYYMSIPGRNTNNLIQNPQH